MSDFRSPEEKQAENKRMMLAMGISMLVVLVWSSLFPPPAPVAQPVPADDVKVAAVDEAAPNTDSGTADQPASPSAAKPAAAPPVVPAKQAPVDTEPAIAEQSLELEDGRRLVRLSNRGAQPVAIELIDQAHQKIYREPGTEAERPKVDLAGNRLDFASLNLPGLNAEKTWKVAQANAESVVFTTRAGNLELRRSWTLAEHGLAHRLEIKAVAPAAGKAELSLSMQDPLLGGSMFSGPPDLPRSLCHDGQELKVMAASDLKDEDESRAGAPKPHFFGVDRNFFAVLFTGEEAHNCRLDLRSVSVEGHDKPVDVVIARAERSYDLAAGASLDWSNTLYLLPKSDDLLASIDPTLRDTIDFGIFKFIAQPMLWLLTFYFSLLGNYGFAIILLTFTVKLLLWPITDISFRSMARMKEIQPELSALREKYKADKQSLAQKQMELFKERGVNPAGGCLPMLLQIPVWFALYSTLRVAVELYGSPFIPGWLDDLTLADPYYILPVLLGVVFFMQQKLQPQMTDNPQQQMMMKVMPVMMTVFMVALPSGLVVYILVNTVLGIAHQFYAIKRDAKPAAA